MNVNDRLAGLAMIWCRCGVPVLPQLVHTPRRPVNAPSSYGCTSLRRQPLVSPYRVIAA